MPTTSQQLGEIQTLGDVIRRAEGKPGVTRAILARLVGTSASNLERWADYGSAARWDVLDELCMPREMAFDYVSLTARKYPFLRVSYVDDAALAQVPGAVDSLKQELTDKAIEIERHWTNARQNDGHIDSAEAATGATLIAELRTIAGQLATAAANEAAMRRVVLARRRA